MSGIALRSGGVGTGVLARARPRRGRFWLLLVVLLVAGVVVVGLRHTRDKVGEGASTSAPSASAPSAPSGTPTSQPGTSGADRLQLADLDGLDATSRSCLLGRPARVVQVGRAERSPRWRRDLVERFDRLDPDRWTARDDTRLNHDRASLLARNVSTRGGRLAISARREAVAGRAFTSGFVETDGKYTLPDTFQVAVRAKVPVHQGLWAAPLWLRPADGSAGEIDVVETTHRPGEAPRVHHSIHTAYGPKRQVAAHRYPFADVGDRAGTRWHTYVLRKTPGLMVVWVDGKVTAAFCVGAPDWYDTYYDAGKRWSMRINLQVGGWGGGPRPGEAWRGGSATLLVDKITTWVPER